MRGDHVVEFAERNVERNRDEPGIGVRRERIARSANFRRTGQDLEGTIATVVADLGDKLGVGTIDLKVPVFMAIPDMNLLHPAFAGHVDFEEDLAIVGGPGGFLVLDLVQVPIRKKDVGVAGYEE